MGVSLKEMMDRLPEERRRRVEARTAGLVADEMTLRELRRAIGKTQAEVAAKLHMKQENVSRVEQRTDVLLSTLARYVDALGGRLRLTVEFKGRQPMQITTLAGLMSEEQPGKPSRGRTTAARKARAPRSQSVVE